MDMEKVKKFLDGMVQRGKITQKDADEKLTKRIEKENVKKNYKDNKSKMSKAELQTALDTLTAE